MAIVLLRTAMLHWIENVSDFEHFSPWRALDDCNFFFSQDTFQNTCCCFFHKIYRHGSNDGGIKVCLQQSDCSWSCEFKWPKWLLGIESGERSKEHDFQFELLSSVREVPNATFYIHLSNVIYPWRNKLCRDKRDMHIGNRVRTYIANVSKSNTRRCDMTTSASDYQSLDCE